MKPTDDEESERMLRLLLRRFDPLGGDAGGCPGDHVLATLLDGRLLPAEREVLERHLAGCRECHEVLATLRAAGAPLRAPAPAAAPPAGRRLRLPIWLPTAAAAAVVLGALLVPGLLRARGGPEERLVAAARALTAARPDLFGDLRVLGAAERAAPAPSPRRDGAGLALVHPSGRVLEPRPSFRWRTAAGVGEVRITVRGPAGVLWSAPVPDAGPGAGEVRFPYPEREPALPAGVEGSWQVAGEGLLGPVEETRSFRVATPAERAAWSEAAREIDARAPAAERALLRAQLAIRREYLAEAETAAREALAARPGDALARETLALVLRLLGLPAAEEAR
jgi:hypothetical protein